MTPAQSENDIFGAMVARRVASGRRYDGALWPTREAKERSALRALIANGCTPTRATYDDAGNCAICGECGRCYGWHAVAGAE